MKRIALLFHPRIPESRPLAEEIREELIPKGVDFWLVSAWEEEKIAARIATLDLLVTLGGDGTVLRAARLAAAHGTPILAVNMGHLGFLAEAEPEEVREKLTAILEGDYWVDERNMLHATLLRGGTQIEAYEALNDVVVARGVMARALHLTTSVDGQKVTTYIADGVIVATATGSTAYSLAAGGPILDPRLRELLVTPIAPHLSTTHSLVLPAHSEIKVTIESDQPATLTIDGQIHQELLNSDTVVVKASEHLCRLFRTQPRDYFYKNLQKRLKERLTMTEVTYCANHPDRETLLRCNKCGKPICPECAIRHPVGLRCRECAQLRRIPTYDLSPRHYVLALAAGLPSAIVGVTLGGIISRFLFIPFIGGFIPWLVAFAVGLLVAQAISRATRYKRGVGLQVVAAICVVFGYFIGSPLSLLVTSYLLVGRIALVPFWAWLDFYSIIYLILAILAAVGRLR